jgi:glycosyltransferase involved in cell wall biosynthesis
VRSVLTPLRVCVDARLGHGISGGVEQVVVGLAAGLSKLEDGDEEYLFLVHPDQDEWIRPYVKGPCRLLYSGLEYPGQPGFVRMVRHTARRWIPFLRGWGVVLGSDGTIERAEVDVVHFPMPEAFRTDVTSIYQPHDLQHLHLPELFPRAERQRREVVYRTHCEAAELVVMMTSWGRRDLLRHYGLPDERVTVVNWGSAISDYPVPSDDEVKSVRLRLSLPETFLLYPAQTWPHKNHLRLLEALAMIRERDGIAIPLVCPGRKNEFYPRVEACVRELGLGDVTWFPGFVSPPELGALYAMARALVFPSRFEGWGIPICEAFSQGVPVASSSATGLPDVVGDAGLLFDPDRPEQIADQVERLWTDQSLRDRLAERGRRRAERFSIDHSVRLLRAHYRRLAGRPLSTEDHRLLASPPLA